MGSAESEATGQIKRGFVWLGAASVVTRVLDACFTLGVLWLVSREELGLATLAWSVGVFIEAFNGLGIGTALIQSPDVDDGLLSDSFWYALGVAVLLVGAVWLAAPALASVWDNAALVPLIRASSTKLFFVGAALVPLTLLNRSMKFERIALANTLATFSSGATTMALAWAGFGAWSFVLGQLMYGVTIAGAAFALQPFRPALAFSPARIRPAAVFGARAAGAGIIYHLYRNADYFLLGRFLGVAALGVYRVAFELAMTPTVTLLNVVNRSALPAYARLQTDRPALTRALGWTSKSLSLMLAPITVLLAFGARDLLALINHGEWNAAAGVLPWLAWAAFLRSLTQVFPQVFYAIGRPSLALLEAVASAAVLCLSFLVALQLFGGDYGILTVGWAWFIGSSLLLALLFKLTQRVLPLSFLDLVTSLAPAVCGLAVLSLMQLALSWQIPATTPPLWTLLARTLVLGVGYAAYLRIVLHMRLSDLSLKPATAAVPAAS
ncbi:MAG: lipopolysaccharide biosynthesis protein [Myxococcaceae bacterium]|nr:lipopolysaccharide biosynthesis protein [Myxococcaceae bacterium]